MVNKYFKLFLFTILLVFAISFVSAWDFYGYAYDINGTALYNVTVNITFWTIGGGAPTLVGSNATTSNAIGWFNQTIHENSSYFYKPVIRHFEQNKTDGSTPIDYVGQSLPWFPFGEFNDTTDINFYLREAGTINITILNRTGGRDYFYYQIKDTKLGYPIEEDWNTMTNEAILYLPIDRNYSIMVYPNQSVPVSFNWNNFSSVDSYNITTTNLSQYTNTTHTLQYQFNCTDNGVYVTGYIQNSSGDDFADWNEFTVITYLLEPGNMVYLGQTFPYNMSFGPEHNASDSYNLTSGFFNISLPGATETSNIILFATARNGSSYYGGFRNLTLDYSSSDAEINFTMYPLMSIDWASANSNITMDDFGAGGKRNVSTARQAFNLVNTTNETLESVDAHIEIIVDYSDYNCTEFTFMTDLSNENGTFYVPLINETGVKEMNIYTTGYAPKRVATMTASEIGVNPNITMASWNPRDMEGDLNEEDIFIEFYISSSTCDVPNPDEGCQIGAFGPDEEQERENFSPLSAIIGGGKLSFRMGYGGIKIHYVNVDMLASGPPDIAFDSAATESKPSGGAFSSALRFGSMGPTIYDYVLVSIPYTQGSTSVAGLDESEDVNMSLPLFYTGDDVDILIWNTATNGTNGTLLAGNYSHYSTYSSEWETLMGNNTCVTNVNLFNATNPCYIDTTNDRIWIRIPHFDGNEPSISGSSTTVSEDDTTSPGGGSSGVPEVKEIHLWTLISPGIPVIMRDFDSEIGIKQIQIEVHTEAQDVKITVTKHDTKPADVSVEKSGKVYKYLQVETENLEDKLEKAVITIQVNKSWVSNNSLEEDDITLFKFNESEEEWDELTTTSTGEDTTYYYYKVELDRFSYFAISEKAVEGEEELVLGVEKSKLWLWILVAVVIITIIVWQIKIKKK